MRWSTVGMVLSESALRRLCSRAPLRRRGPVLEFFVVTDRAKVRGMLIDERLGLRDRLVVHHRTYFREEVVEDERCLEIADFLRHFVGEVLADRRDGLLARAGGDRDRGGVAHCLLQRRRGSERRCRGVRAGQSNWYFSVNGCSFPCPTADVPSPRRPRSSPVAEPGTTE